MTLHTLLVNITINIIITCSVLVKILYTLSLQTCITSWTNLSTFTASINTNSIQTNLIQSTIRIEATSTNISYWNTTAIFALIALYTGKFAWLVYLLSYAFSLSTYLIKSAITVTSASLDLWDTLSVRTLIILTTARHTRSHLIILINRASYTLSIDTIFSWKAFITFSTSISGYAHSLDTTLCRGAII